MINFALIGVFGVFPGLFHVTQEADEFSYAGHILCVILAGILHMYPPIPRSEQFDRLHPPISIEDGRRGPCGSPTTQMDPYVCFCLLLGT